MKKFLKRIIRNWLLDILAEDESSVVANTPIPVLPPNLPEEVKMVRRKPVRTWYPTTAFKIQEPTQSVPKAQGVFQALKTCSDFDNGDLPRSGTHSDWITQLSTAVRSMREPQGEQWVWRNREPRSRHVYRGNVSGGIVSRTNTSMQISTKEGHLIAFDYKGRTIGKRKISYFLSKQLSRDDQSPRASQYDQVGWISRTSTNPTPQSINVVDVIECGCRWSLVHDYIYIDRSDTLADKILAKGLIYDAMNRYWYLIEQLPTEYKHWRPKSGAMHLLIDSHDSGIRHNIIRYHRMNSFMSSRFTAVGQTPPPDPDPEPDMIKFAALLNILEDNELPYHITPNGDVYLFNEEHVTLVRTIWV